MNPCQIRTEGHVAYVPLTQGYVAVIDAEDVPLVEGFRWVALIDHRKDGSIRRIYAVRKEGPRDHRRNILMHRAIAKTPDGFETDHHDGDGLNNRKVNLRTATTAQNAHNQCTSAANTSGFKGVHWNKQQGKWQARIRIPGERRHLGYFATKEAAAARYAEESVKLHGEFGRTA